MVTIPPRNPKWADLAGRESVLTASGKEERLDAFIAASTGISRGMARELIDFGAVWVGDKVCRRQSRVLLPGDTVRLHVPHYGPVRFYEADPDRILYRDSWLLAYDKEAGLPSQQTPYDGYNHLYGALERLTAPGYLALHHRLDRMTSGVIVFSRRREINRDLGRLFSQGMMEKTYLAVVEGRPAEDCFAVDRPIARRAGGYYCPSDRRGKPAVTEFQVLSRKTGFTTVQARPLTGRTHQIRLHLAAEGLPILGDPLYGGARHQRLMLHAFSLAFNHPGTGHEIRIEAPAPEGFQGRGRSA